jgi:hypothetical protein
VSWGSLRIEAQENRHRDGGGDSTLESSLALSPRSSSAAAVQESFNCVAQ